MSTRLPFQNLAREPVARRATQRSSNLLGLLQVQEADANPSNVNIRVSSATFINTDVARLE